MRVRLSTLTANTPMNVTMPLQGQWECTWVLLLDGGSKAPWFVGGLPVAVVYNSSTDTNGVVSVAAKHMLQSCASILCRCRCLTIVQITGPNAYVYLTPAGERTNLRGGHPAAAVAHLYLHLQVPQLFGSYLRSYFKYTASSPGLYLLASKRSNKSHISAQGQTGISLDVLAMQAEQATAR